MAWIVGPVSEQNDVPAVSQEIPMIRLTVTQQSALTLNPRTGGNAAHPDGFPARLDGPPEWANSNPSVVSLTVAADGLSAVIKSLAPGAAQITVTADADLDAGEVREITGVLDVEVMSGEAVTLGVTAGTPSEQVVPPIV
jgi:hypothetical protein